MDKKKDTKKRPSLGTGMAENAAKKLENRQSQLDKALAKAMGEKPKKKTK